MTSPKAPYSQIPPDVFCARDYERAAAEAFDPPLWAYIAGGSGAGTAAKANLQAFAAWSVVPRLLRDVTHGHTQLTLAGHAHAHPILLAPVAYQSLAHPLGELETARASQATDTTMVTSTLASRTLEDIAQAAQPHRWFQLYLQDEEADTLDLVARAERAGYRGLVVTLDATLQVAGHDALRAGFRLPASCVAANLPAKAPSASPMQGVSRIFQGMMRQAPTRAAIERLMHHTTLPVWIKGVMHPDDARLAGEIGAAGVIVSNHGGRGLESAPASLQVLSAVRQAVGNAMHVLFDGGIRSGGDVFKALAFGADAVLVGRLQMYALRVAGALGVAHMLKLLRDELEVTMAQAGCATLSDIYADCLMPSLPAPDNTLFFHSGAPC